MSDETDQLVIDAVQQLEIEAGPLLTSEPQVDLVLDPGGVAILLRIKRYSLVSDETARRLIEQSPARQSRTDKGQPARSSIPFVVADRVTATARKLLIAHGWGYLDLRGHLALRTEQLIVDVDVEPALKQSERSDPLAGKAGLEVAAALLMEPARRPAVRQLARELNRSPSTVSEVLSALRQENLVDQAHRVAGTDLFWELADRWPTKRTYLERAPRPGERDLSTVPLRLGLENIDETTGWALTDTVAAAMLGAPIGVRADQSLDFFVPDQATMHRARTILGTARSSAETECSVRVAPLPAVCNRRIDLASSHVEWPIAHPLFVALDLAQDTGRGREILRDWTPTGTWARVW